MQILSSFLSLFLYSFSISAQEKCRDLFVLAETSTAISAAQVLQEQPEIVIQTPKSELLLTTTGEQLIVKIKLESGGTRSSDLSYDAVAFTLLQINPTHIQKILGRTIYIHVERKITQRELETFANQISQAIREIEKLVEKNEPPSLREKSDFDFESPLDLFHNSISPQVTPSAFNRNYTTHFAVFREKLPTALKAVMSTEFYLPKASAKNVELASLILQATYRVSPQQALKSLERLSEDFITFLGNSDTRKLGGSVYKYGLIPLNDLLPKPRYISASGPRVNRPEGHDLEASPIDGYNRLSRPSKDNFDFLYEGPIVWSRRTALIEDVPFEILDFGKITAIKEKYGAQTMVQLAKVPAIHLMYDLGANNLTRNELRNLYYYLRDEHQLKMSITEELALRLNIFRVF